MSNYYKPLRVRNIYNPDSAQPFRLSRSKIDLFIKCPRCFYFDRRLGVAQPPGYPFSLNSAVDTLLKKEFDIHRVSKTSHPLIKSYGIDAIPYQHPKIDEWRDSLRGGITFLHTTTNLLITGGVDDVWINPNDELIIVDYKSTAKEGEVSLDAEWQDGYKRQMEIYQWLFRKNGFKVSNTGYFVYCNGLLDKEAFDAKLEFNVKLIPYEGKDNWIEPVLLEIHQCLQGNVIPPVNPDCDFCQYVKTATTVERDFLNLSKNVIRMPELAH